MLFNIQFSDSLKLRSSIYETDKELHWYETESTIIYMCVCMQNICNNLIFHTLQKPDLMYLHANVLGKYGLVIIKLFI
jgi:hypothetical protein